MTSVSLLCDFQCYPDDVVDASALYRETLSQIAYADGAGIDAVTFPEHHGGRHGYLPAPVVAAAAAAGATQRIRLTLAALVLPFYDVVRVAEDLAVLDLASGGRIDIVIGAGYVPDEFAMFGADPAARAVAVEAGVAFLRRAWTAEPFEYRGRQVRVTPRPVQQPHPPIVLGGSSHAAARRAARIACGFRPTSPEYWATFRAERVALGADDPGDAPCSGPFVFHVAEDPDAARAEIGAAVLRGANQYLELAAIATGGEPVTVADLDQLVQFGMVAIVDPDEAVARCRALGPTGTVVLQPRFGGIPLPAAWSSLELFATKVLPALPGGGR
jgi:alkanesulfonate monooxygenase SsuD/methylene tetrahydromethanopterin reductase-like flavin-dependent oxidoreductase (luciferase family)